MSPTESRAAVLRRKHRRIFRWSLAIAVVAHGLVFWLAPWIRTAARGGSSGTELVGEGVDWGGIPVEIFFGPPTIVEGDGGLTTEPEGRTLSASRKIPSPPGCGSNDWLARSTASGEVLLSVNERGRAAVDSVTAPTADPCWNAVLAGLAGDLLYRWLPSERFPAPVSVYQPLTVSVSGG